MDSETKKTTEYLRTDGRRPAAGVRPRANGVGRAPAGRGGAITPTGQRWFRDLPRWMQDKLRAGGASASPLKGNAETAG